MYCKIKAIIENKILCTKIIIDTGNFLRDPITKIPVIVIEKNELYGSIPDKILNNLDKIIFGKDVDIVKYSTKIRIIPFTSLGRENGILLGYKVDNAEILMEENIINIKNVIIGIYDGVLCKSGKYHGLVGLDIIEKNDINDLNYKKLLV